MTAPTDNSLRFLVYQSESPREIMAEMDRLESLYLREFKRRLTVELSFSSWNMVTHRAPGTRPRQLYGLTVYHEATQSDEITWLRQNVRPSVAQESQPNPV